MQLHIAHTGEKAHSRGRVRIRSCRVWCRGTCQRAVQRHRLRGIFYTAGDSEPVVRAQRIVERAVRTGAAADVPGVPADDFVEQAHAALVGDARLDPRSVHSHGWTCTAARDTSR
jgi:hypothetical protein